MNISVLTPSIRPGGLKPNQKALSEQTFQSFEWLVELGIPERGHDLNAAFNKMIRRAKGELIVFMEDWTKCLPSGLEKFWNAYKSEPNVFWTAPLGKTDDWEDIRWDWRAYSDTKCNYPTWEIDWACAPKEALYEIGGFDEELDKYWSCDNVNVGYRAYLKGYQFKNLIDNPAIAYDHDKFIKHPFREKFNPQYNQERMNSFTPDTKLSYLE